MHLRQLLLAAFVSGVLAACGTPASAPDAAAHTSENTSPACKDGTDNDQDGHTDCADQDCDEFVFCHLPDAAALREDAATSTPDASAAPGDAELAPPDAAGTPPDASSASEDASTVVISDATVGSPDAAPLTLDAANPPDASFTPADAATPPDASCLQQCAGKTCGDDGCGGTCGSCGADFCQRDGTCLPCPDTGGQTTIETLCSLLDGSFKKWFAWRYQACGNLIDDAAPGALHTADIDFLDAEMFQWGYAKEYGYQAEFPIGPLAPTIVCADELGGPYLKLKEAVAKGRVCFDSKAVDDCVQAGLDARASGNWGAAPPPRCREFFVPHQEEGQPCDSQWECAAGLYCKAADGGRLSCGGVCARPLADGEPCTRSERCAESSHCLPVADAGLRCVPPPQVGELCPDGECSSGNYCAPQAVGADAGFVDDAGQPAYRCVPRGTAGAPCDLASRTCADGLLCLAGGTTGPHCAVPPEGQLGDSCGGDLGIECGGCLYCAGEIPDLQTGVCLSTSKVGDPCINGECNGPHLNRCDTATGTCVLRPRRGEPCHEDAAGNVGRSQPGDCLYLGDYCKRSAPGATGVCTAFPGLGEACNDTPNLSMNCTGGTYCKGSLSTTVDGVCAPLESTGAVCDATTASLGTCKEELACLGDSSDSQGVCGPLPVAGEPCARFAGGDDVLVCDEVAWCDLASDAGVATCVAKRAPGEPCRDSSECLKGECGSEGVCLLDCFASPETGSDGCGVYNTFNWFSNLIFVSSLFVWVGRRRRTDSTRRTRTSERLLR